MIVIDTNSKYMSWADGVRLYGEIWRYLDTHLSSCSEFCKVRVQASTSMFGNNRGDGRWWNVERSPVGIEVTAHPESFETVVALKFGNRNDQT